MIESNDNPYVDSYVVQHSDGDVVLARLEYIPSATVESDIIHTVLEGETLQSIAHTYYGDSGSWYKISDVNNIMFPLELEAGTKLIIPE